MFACLSGERKGMVGGGEREREGKFQQSSAAI
jgi:hypothetical protein